MRNFPKALIFSLLLIGCSDAQNSPILDRVDPLLSAVKPLFKTQKDAVDDCLPLDALRAIGFAPQVHEEVERFELGGKEIVAYKFDALSGEYAKEYLFMRYGGGCVDRAFLVGAFQQYQAVDGMISYHFDLYTNSAQSSIPLGSAKPDYESSKNIAIRYLK